MEADHDRQATHRRDGECVLQEGASLRQTYGRASIGGALPEKGRSRVGRCRRRGRRSGGGGYSRRRGPGAGGGAVQRGLGGRPGQQGAVGGPPGPDWLRSVRRRGDPNGLGGRGRRHLRGDLHSLGGHQRRHHRRRRHRADSPNRGDRPGQAFPSGRGGVRLTPARHPRSSRRGKSLGRLWSRWVGSGA